MSNVLNHCHPEDWNESELEVLIASGTKITYGVVQPGKQDPKGVPFIRGGDIYNGKIAINKLRTISQDVSASYKRTLLHGGELLMSLVGYPGEVAIVPKALAGANIARQAAYIKLGKMVDSKYVMYYLQSDLGKYYLFQKSTGSAQQVINLIDLKDVRVVFPPLPEQQKIAAILTSVDEVIENTQAQIDKLKDLKTGMMQELLTVGVGIDGTPHTEFKDSPVGRIPKGWEVEQISTLCSHIVDCVNKTAPVVDYQTPYKMIRTTNVRHGRVDTENVRNVTKETYETWTRRLLPEAGDLIFTREAPVGECGILEDARGIFLGQRTMMYRADETKTSSKFLMYSLMSEYGKQQLEDFSGGSTVPHMRVPDCGKILIKTPSLIEQNKIVNSINSIDTSILRKEKKLFKVQDTKKALMQDLLTGKVRVNVGVSSSPQASSLNDPSLTVS